MEYVITPYVAPFAVAAVMGLAIALAAWRLRPSAGSTELFLVMLSSAEWALASAMEAAAATLELKVFWSQMGYVGGTSLPVFALLLALRYSHLERLLTPWAIALYWLLPILGIVAAATNSQHYLVWPSFSTIDPVTNLIVYGHGPAFWCVVAVTNIYMVASIGVLAATTIRDPNRTFSQTGSLMFGYMVPWFAYVAYVIGASPMPHLDLTPIGALLSGFVLYVSIARYRLFELLPIARDTLVERMSDGILVLDAQQRIVDHNSAAMDTFRALSAPSGGNLIGALASDVLREWPTWLETYSLHGVSQLEISVGHGAEERCFDLHTAPLVSGENSLRGHMTLMRDVTDRTQAERALRASEDRFRMLAEHVPFPLLLSRMHDQRLLYANPAARDLLQLTDQPTGNAQSLVLPASPEDVQALLDQVETHGVAQDHEMLLNQDKPGQAWVLASAITTQFAHESMLLVSLVDITERKRYEQEREALLEQLRAALTSVKTLSGLVPICANCKKIRDDQGYWHAVEQYVSDHSQAQFTHGICPECEEKLYAKLAELEDELAQDAEAS